MSHTLVIITLIQVKAQHVLLYDFCLNEAANLFIGNFKSYTIYFDYIFYIDFYRLVLYMIYEPAQIHLYI